MRNFIERIKSYSKRKDTADMAIRAWKSVNEEVYTNFCKRIDAVAKGGITVLMDMYQMMRDCTPPEALMMYNWLSDFANGKDVPDIANRVRLAFRFCQREGCTRHRKPTMGWPIYRDHRPMYHKQTIVDRYQRKNGDN